MEVGDLEGSWRHNTHRWSPQSMWFVKVKDPIGQKGTSLLINLLLCGLFHDLHIQMTIGKCGKIGIWPMLFKLVTCSLSTLFLHRSIKLSLSQLWAHVPLISLSFSLFSSIFSQFFLWYISATLDHWIFLSIDWSFLCQV